MSGHDTKTQSFVPPEDRALSLAVGLPGNCPKAFWLLLSPSQAGGKFPGKKTQADNK